MPNHRIEEHLEFRLILLLSFRGLPIFPVSRKIWRNMIATYHPIFQQYRRFLVLVHEEDAIHWGYFQTKCWHNPKNQFVRAAANGQAQLEATGT